MRLVSATWRLHLAERINKNIMSSVGTRQGGAGISASSCFPDKEPPILLFSEFDLYLSPFVCVVYISLYHLGTLALLDMKLGENQRFFCSCSRKCNLEVGWSEVDGAITQRNDVWEMCCCFFT